MFGNEPRGFELGASTRSEDVQLRRYLPHVILVTATIAVAPFWIALWATNGHPVWSTVLSIALALAFGRIGASLWQRTEASEDLVFDDLFAWGFLRRIRAQRNITESVRRLGLDVDAAYKDQGLTREEQLKLLRSLAADLERGDPYTHGHSQRVARHAFMVATVMQLPRKQRDKIRLAGLLHDIGKLNVPREVLNKPGRLSDHEYGIVKEHPGAGADLVQCLGDDELTAMIRYHHERIDGTGYPEKRTVGHIPLGARIIAVADTFDAITSRRPYRGAQKHKIAMEILERESGTQLDGDVVQAFKVYYSGRRSIRWWFFLIAGWRHGIEAVLVGLPRFGLVGVANAAAVGGAVVVFAGGAMMHATPAPEKAEPKERQRIVREAQEKGEKAPGLNIADEASDGVSTAHTRARASNGGSSSARSRTSKEGTSSSRPSRARQASTPSNKGETKRPDDAGTKGEAAVAAASSDNAGGTTSAVKQESAGGAVAPTAKTPAVKAPAEVVEKVTGTTETVDKGAPAVPDPRNTKKP